ncbi:MAG TPA: hypothetical protein VMM18_02495 [Gemmatimonadaceae bacterium]|nr:hypothetical protein [Gemmatimonadaceae bacterium]
MMTPASRGFGERSAPRTRLVMALALACVAAGCAGAGRSGSERRDPNLISPAEIEEMHQAGVRDLYELVNRQRPIWLQRRPERSLQLETTILVYLNEARLGGIDALRGYPLLSVVSLRYYDAAQAMLLPGGGSAHVEGAIVIRTGTRPADTSSARSSRPPEPSDTYP